MLLLFPAAMLIVMVLAAIAVDVSIAFLGERELGSAVAAAANDAATDALSNQAFYTEGRLELDEQEVARVAEDRVRAALDASRHLDLSVRATVLPSSGACGWAVSVRASARVRYVFAAALPGGPDEAQVEAEATSSPLQEQVEC